MGNWGHLHGFLSDCDCFKQSQTLHKRLYSAAAFKKSKITSGLTVLKSSCKEGAINDVLLVLYIHLSQNEGATGCAQVHGGRLSQEVHVTVEGAGKETGDG